MARVRGERARCDAAPGNMLSYMREKCRVKVTAASPRGGGSGSGSSSSLPVTVAAAETQEAASPSAPIQSDQQPSTTAWTRRLRADDKRRPWVRTEHTTLQTGDPLGPWLEARLRN
jgi:hypothetical protein